MAAKFGFCSRKLTFKHTLSIMLMWGHRNYVRLRVWYGTMVSLTKTSTSDTEFLQNYKPHSFYHQKMIKPVVIIAFACLTGSTTSGAFTKPSYPCWITKRHREDSCQRHLSYTVHSSFKLSPSVQSYASPSNRRNAHSAGRSYPTDLDTAYEWLATDRLSKDPINHVEIRWFHPSDIGTHKTFRIEADFAIPEKLEKMPLYPLGCVHVPYSQGNYTLINIEESNVKMAKVIIDSFFFCILSYTFDEFYFF